MSTGSEYLEISSGERDETPRRKIWGVTPKKLVSAVVLVMVVAAGVIAVSSSSPSQLNEVASSVEEKKNMVVSPSQDVYYRACTPGTYPVGKICKRCPIGYYCDGKTKTPCASSEYQDCEGQPQCVVIPCGFEGVKKGYYAGGYTSIRACPKGSYRAHGMAKCELVPAGSYGDEEGLCKYIECYEGYYQPKPGQLECPACPCGHYVMSQGAKSCKACGLKMYQPMEGSQECLYIPSGYVVKTPKRCNIKRCPDGYVRVYLPGGKGYACHPSPCGHYVPKGGSKRIPCGYGYYQEKTGQTRCDRIPKGYEVVLPKRCKIKKCEIGHYQNEKGLDKCKPCRPGSYTDKTGSEKCTPCPCGKMAKSSGSDACDSCGAGTYQASEGQSFCAKIEFGYEHDTYGYKPRCGVKICQPGTYRGKAEEKEDKCLKCPKGSSVHHEGAHKCPLCKCGTYADRMGQMMCTRCGRGEYQPLTGQTKCKAAGYKEKVHPSKCNLITYYKNPPPLPPPPSVTCMPLTSGHFKDLKTGGTEVSLGTSGTAAGCTSKCKSTSGCLCYGFETATKKCYLGSSSYVCTPAKGYYSGGMVFGKCRPIAT